MIAGVGTDIVEVDRIRGLIEKYGETFLNKVLLPQELAVCNASANKVQRVAARFAAKEALSKALGTGLSAEVCFQNIEISNGAQGEPILTLHGAAAQLQQERGITQIHLSMSHADHYATAVVILESNT